MLYGQRNEHNRQFLSIILFVEIWLSVLAVTLTGASQGLKRLSTPSISLNNRPGVYLKFRLKRTVLILEGGHLNEGGAYAVFLRQNLL